MPDPINPSTPPSRATLAPVLLALALIPMPALATEPSGFVEPPVPPVCTFGPAGSDYPQGTMVLACEPQAKEVKP
jgi:hypothetical protein